MINFKYFKVLFRKINKQMQLKKIFQFFSSKSVLGALFFAISLWIYVSLSTEYVINTEVPLIIQLPNDRAIEVPPPETISIDVKGTGWHLFNFLFIGSSANCQINLEKTSIKDSIYEISRTDILKGMQHLVNVQAIDAVVENNKLLLITGKAGNYQIPVKSKVKIHPKEGFILIGKTEIIPDSIIISGNEKITTIFKEWNTEEKLFNDVYLPLSTKINLSTQFSNIVKLSTKEVDISVDVQQEASVTFVDIPVSVIEGKLPRNSILEPEILRVTVKGGINDISNLSSVQIKVQINIQQLLNDSTGIVVPNIILPKNLKVANINPPFLYHRIRI